MTRHDLGYISSQLAYFLLSNPARIHLEAAARVLDYLQSSNDSSPCASRPVLRAYVDSDRGSRFSTSGAAWDCIGTLIHWVSETQRSVSMSSTEAECFAACVGAHDIQQSLHMRKAMLRCLAFECGV